MGATWRSLRVVQISDLHVGPTIRRSYVEKLVSAVNDLAPDLIVITGDLVDGFVSQLADQIEPLRGLRAPHGVLFVTGNHEYFYRADEWLDALRSMGITVLSNSHTILDHGGASILIAGLEDPVASSSTNLRELALREAIVGAPESSLRILLAHRPNDVIAASANGFDLQLSGHVHAGQFFPFTWLTRWIETYSDGLYSVGKTWLYVNRGAGHWGPTNRLGARQELTLFEIVPV
jgi:predicted MPP superfamily phosphohydrolase